MSDENIPGLPADARQQQLADILTVLRDQREDLLSEEKQLTDAIAQLTADRPALPETVLQINDRLLYVFDTFLSPGFTEARCTHARELINKAVRHIKKNQAALPAGPYVCRFIAVPWQNSPTKKENFKGINTVGIQTFVQTVSTLIRQDL